MTANRHFKRSLAREPVRAAVARRVPLTRWMMALCGFVAIVIQSLVVQTHIHIPQASGAAIQTVSIATIAAHIGAKASVPAVDETATPRDKYPINEDPSNCPLCQEIAHSGQFVHSVAALAALPAFVSVHFVVFKEVLPSFFAVSHNWRGRAPPRA